MPRKPNLTATRFRELEWPHPFEKWWQKHGQYMMSGGGHRERIWAFRGWIAREQLMDGSKVTGECLNEKPPDA